jgi:hypothetical protein
MSARTILNPPLINELSGLFNGTTSINTSSVNIGVQPDNILLTCPTAGNLSVGGGVEAISNISTSTGNIIANAGNIEGINCYLTGGINTSSVNIGVQPDNILLTCPTAGNLSVGGAIRAYSYTGGIGGVSLVLNLNASNAGSIASVNTTIPNFVGSASSLYLSQSNIVNAATPFTTSVSFTSATSTSTNIEIFIYFVADSSGGSFPISILGFNI